MSGEIRNELGKAADEVRKIQSAYCDMLGASFTNRTKRSNFGDFMTATTEFIADKIDNIYNVIDEAADEIERLADENEELIERVKELESRVEGLGEDK